MLGCWSHFLLARFLKYQAVGEKHPHRLAQEPGILGQRRLVSGPEGRYIGPDLVRRNVGAADASDHVVRLRNLGRSDPLRRLRRSRRTRFGWGLHGRLLPHHWLGRARRRRLSPGESRQANRCRDEGNGGEPPRQPGGGDEIVHRRHLLIDNFVGVVLEKVLHPNAAEANQWFLGYNSVAQGQDCGTASEFRGRH